MNRSQFDADRAFAEELQRREIEGSGAELGQLNPLPPAPPTSRSRVPNLTLPANSELVRPRSTHQVSEGNQQSVLTRITSFFQITDTATARTRAPPGSEFSLARSQSGQIRTLGRTGDGNVQPCAAAEAEKWEGTGFVATRSCCCCGAVLPGRVWPEGEHHNR